MQIQVRRNVRGFAFGLVVALLASGILAAAGGGVVQAAGSGGGGSDEGLVAEWRFDEGAGSVLHDSSGNGNDGTIHGATWTEGKFGNALRFDGRDDYVSLPKFTTFSSVTDFTVEVWFKMNSHNPNGRSYLIDFRGDGSLTSDNLGLIIDNNRGISEIHHYIDPWPSGSRTEYAISISSPVGDWHHTAFVRKGGNLIVYYDGVKSPDVFIPGYSSQKSDPLNWAESKKKIGTCYLDAARCKGNYWFKGKIDEVRIYNRALTAEEIKQQYEGKQAELTLTKSVSPHTIKQGQSTTVTVTVENTGTSELRDIEVADEVPAAADLTFVSGETAKKYDSLKPEDTRVFQYILETKEAGRFNLGEATATYADEDGNYQTAKSNTATLEVIPALPSPTGSPSAPAPAPTSSPSTPGFEAVFAVVAGLLGVAFVLRGRR